MGFFLLVRGGEELKGEARPSDAATGCLLTTALCVCVCCVRGRVDDRNSIGDVLRPLNPCGYTLLT